MTPPLLPPQIRVIVRDWLNANQIGAGALLRTHTGLAWQPRAHGPACAKSHATFILLDKGGMPLADPPGYLAQIPFYRECNERYIRLPPAELAERLVTELERAGAVRREAGRLIPG